MGKAKLILGLILLLIGLFYASAPHDLHIALGVDFNMDHLMHQIGGVILIIIGLAIMIKGRK